MIRTAPICAATGLALVTSAPVHAQSVDCRHAKLPAVVTICLDAELSEYDTNMARQHAAALRVMRSPAQRLGLRAKQGSWIKQRNRCGYNAGCILRVYQGWYGWNEDSDLNL